MSTIPGLVTIEFTKDTTDSAGNPKRSKGDRLLVDKKQAEIFVKKGAAKLLPSDGESRQGLAAVEAKPDTPSGAS